MAGRRIAAASALILLSSAAFAQSLETAIMPGQVIKGHARLESECKNCHVRFNRAAQTRLCVDCHKDIARDISRRRGFHGRLSERECRACHTDHKGRNADIAPVKARSFDHRQTDFVLRGGHASPTVECRACHVPGKKYREAPSDCYACHKKDDKHRGKLGRRCADCHSEVNWKRTRFDHSKTRFPLRNGHADVACQSCHKSRDFKGAPLACVACHLKDDQRKGHRGAFGKKCETCHTDRAWKTSKFDHDRDTRYPLRGRHELARCTSCHKGTLYQEKLPTACVACHRKDDQKTGHRGRFGEKCESCHIEKAWTSTTFDHGKTRYPLRGRHARIRCASCHTGILYRENLKTACIGCHLKDDKHRGQLGPKCESCHNEASWRRTRFDHGLTRFPLLGKHASAKCEACHTTPQYKDTKTDCYSCHRKDDRHKLRLGTLCGECHNARNWKQWNFDHDKRTRFALDGKHAGLDCHACHKFAVSGRAVVAAACVSCHEDRDVHNGGFGRVCERCHVTSSFKTIRPGSAGRLFR